MRPASGGAVSTCDARISAALKDERAEVNATLLTSCIQAVGNLSQCGVSPAPGELTDCENAIRGRQARGATCFANEECAAADSCDNSATCPGVCIERVALGGTVTGGAECAAGLENYGNTCIQPVALGASCAGTGSTGPKPCVAGAYCSTGSGTCAALKTSGAACAQADECLGNLACVNGTCATRAGVGATCSLSEFSCKLDLTCKVMDLSTPTPMGTCDVPGGAGTSCFMSLDCAQGFTCLGASFFPQTTPGTCQARLAVGATCDAQMGDPCVESAFCSSSGTCTAKKTSGQSCDPNAQECAEALTCTAGTCQPSQCTDPTP